MSRSWSNAVRVPVGDEWVGVWALDRPPVLHRLAAHGRGQMRGVVEGEREHAGAEGGAGLFAAASRSCSKAWREGKISTPRL